MEVTIEDAKSYCAYVEAFGYKFKTTLGQTLAKLFVLFINKQSKECTKTIICQCNRRSCPYRTLAISTYIRKMKYDT
jgi:hypothetical protein